MNIKISLDTPCLHTTEREIPNEIDEKLPVWIVYFHCPGCRSIITKVRQKLGVKK
jgi:hypothetical protein